jgi:hypothetical protein
MTYVDLALDVYYNTRLAAALDRMRGVGLLPVMERAFTHKVAAENAFTTRTIQSTPEALHDVGSWGSGS